jgi:hypothetical protein
MHKPCPLKRTENVYPRCRFKELLSKFRALEIKGFQGNSFQGEP